MLRETPDDDAWIHAHSKVIGARIHDRRIELNVTQEALYLAAGIDRRTLQNLESGQLGNPTLATLMRIARALGTSLSELIG
ncbi:helix-turn-helix transcriptional regulator [Streptomyces sp. NPDC004237]|uniref:helix-turn-helix domain-containing protein n=1 Tax=Streptomyces sp. NPDC004237 TaxID=3154455 RepID=UPI00339F7743